MKKLICLVLVLMCCLTACHFTQDLSGALAGDAESTSQVKEMLTVLAEKRTSDAKALMHPQVAENADAAITQMSDYLAGREASSMEMVHINVTNSAGTSGKTRQEQVGYRITLTDGSVIHLNVVYLSDKAGTGFTSFQLVLGVV